LTHLNLLQNVRCLLHASCLLLLRGQDGGELCAFEFDEHLSRGDRAQRFDQFALFGFAVGG